MKIGVTGSTGVLGTILIKELEKSQYYVVPFIGDIRDSQKLLNWIKDNTLDTLVHLAAKVPVNEVEKNPVEAIDVNVGGTISLLKAIETSGLVDYLFYASTCHVYGISQKPLKETDKILPINKYGYTKLLGEQIIELSADTIKLKYCIGRIFSFYHTLQKPPFLYPNIKKRLIEEDLSLPFLIKGALSTRDFLNAEEVVYYILQLIERRASGVINIGSGKATSIKDFVINLLPEETEIYFDENEPKTHLVANTRKLKRILNG